MTNEIEICPYCGNSIRPLDQHVVNIKADKPEKLIRVSCLLVRYYNIETVNDVNK